MEINHKNNRESRLSCWKDRMCPPWCKRELFIDCFGPLYSSKAHASRLQQNEYSILLFLPSVQQIFLRTVQLLNVCLVLLVWQSQTSANLWLKVHNSLYETWGVKQGFKKPTYRSSRSKSWYRLIVSVVFNVPTWATKRNKIWGEITRMSEVGSTAGSHASSICFK